MSPRRTTVALLCAAAGVTAVPASAGAAELIGVCGTELCVAGDTGAITALTSDGAAGAYGTPSASADGTRITYVRGTGLFRAGLRNAGPENLFETDNGRDAATSQDGQSFAFRTFDGRVGPGGYVVESNLRIGGAVGSALWTNQREVNYAAFLGNQLAVTQTDGPRAVACLVAVIPDGPPPCGPRVADDPTREIGRFAASPDGRFVAAEAFVDDGNLETPDPTVIALYDAAGGAPIRDLTAGPADADPTVSPDGTQVAFTRGADTWVVPVVGGEARLLAAGMVNASWYQPPAVPGSPPPGGGGTTPAPPATPGKGRPLGPKGKLRVRKGRLKLRVRCGDGAPCARTTWTFKQRKRVRLRVKVPAIDIGRTRTLRVKVPRATLRRIGRRGLKLRVTGAGFKPRIVKLVKR